MLTEVFLMPLPDYEPETRRTRPVPRHSWMRTRSLLDEYVAALEALGEPDPTPASEHRERSLRLKAASRNVAETDVVTRARIAADLAHGDLDPADARKALTRGAMPSDQREAAALERSALSDAALGAYAAGLRSVAAHGEERWLELLRGHAHAALDAATDTRSAARWDAVMHLQRLLRALGAIAHVPGLSPTTPAYYLADFDAWWTDTCATAHRLDVRARAVRDGNEYLIANAVHPAPIRFSDVAANRERWGVDLYSAADALAHLEAQRRHVDDIFTAPVTAPV